MIARSTIPTADPYADQLLPRDLDSERALLGSMLLSGDAMTEAAGMVPAEAFSVECHSKVWEAFIRTNRAGSPADLTLVQAELLAAGELGSVGGLDALITLAESVPSAANWRWYARCVLLAHRRRMLIEAAENAKRSAFDGGDVDEAIDTLSGELGTLQAIQKRRPERIKTIIPRILDEIYRDGSPSGIPFGLNEIDRIVSPMRPGQLLIVGASTGMGKTALALTIIADLLRRGVPSLIISLEMGVDELGKRLIARESGVPVRALERPNKRDGEAIARAMGCIESLPLDLQYAPGATICAVAATIKTWAGRSGGGVAVVDYLQLMRDPGHRVREAEVAACSRGLKALAGEAGVTIIAPSQLNRETDRRDSRRPRLSDLRESGAIEQDADVVLLLHRDDAVHWTDPEYVKTHEAQVLIAKQRNGPTGLAILRWDAARMTFVSREPATASADVEEIPI